MDAPSPLTEILRALKEEADRLGPLPPRDFDSWEEYREDRDRGFTGYAPRAGELDPYQ